MHPSQQVSIQFLDLDIIAGEYNRRLRILSDIRAIDSRPAANPKKPTHIESPEDWERYQTEVRNEQYLAQEEKSKKELWSQEAAAIEQNIIRALPENTWVKLNQLQLWIGYSTSDWPGYKPTLETESEKPTRILKHQTSS